MMAENTSVTYCDSEEETFFGSVTDKERAKSATFGQNYFSPAVNSSTPRGSRPKSSALLPDVLKRSTCKSFNKDLTAKEYSKYDFDSYLSYGDQEDCSASIDKGGPEGSSMMTDDDVKTTEEVIDLTDIVDLSGSVSGLSDLQEFQIDIHSGKKNNATADTIELDDSSFLSEPDPGYKHNDETSGGDVSGGVIIESVGHNQTPKKENNKSMCTIDTSDLGIEIAGIKAEIDRSGSDEFLSVNDNSVTTGHELIDPLTVVQATLQMPPSPICNNSSIATDQSYRTGLSECQANNTDLSNEHLIESVTESNTFETANQSTEGHMEALFNLEQSSVSSPSYELTFNENTGNKSEISELDYQSINAISDSVLNISHGSSIANLSVKCDSQVRSSLPSVIYEDISCDGDHLDQLDHLDLTNESKDDVSPADRVDLHMSVDEPDTVCIGLGNHFEPSVNTSQSSLYKSCTNTSVGSSYCTALNAESRNPSILQEPLSQFYSYRDTISGSPIEGIPTVSDLEVAEENINESSFEIIAQNRQNSFTKSPENKPTATIVEQVKPKPTSKLPVFATSTSLLKPPKIQVKTDKLISHNYLWAKNLPKEAVKKTNVNSDKPGVSNIRRPNLKSKIPSNTFEGKTPGIKCQTKTIATPTMKTNIAPLTKTPSEKIANRVLTKSKTPAENKTPGQSLMRQPSRLVKSASKLPRATTPVIKINTPSEKKGQLKNSPVAVLQDRDRYKNVISPIRAYISGSPSVLIKKANPSVETLIVSNELGSRLPKKVHTPLRAPKAVQKLNYGCPQERENVNPNHTRDTLPPRIFQTADAIFLKEPEQPRKHLPKMGEHMQRILDTPRPKIIVHQGRVNQSPTAKGILISSSDKSPDFPASRISVRVVKSAEKSDTLN